MNNLMHKPLCRKNKEIPLPYTLSPNDCLNETWNTDLPSELPSKNVLTNSSFELTKRAKWKVKQRVSPYCALKVFKQRRSRKIALNFLLLKDKFVFCTWKWT